MHSTLLVRAFGSSVKDAALNAWRAASDDRYANLGSDDEETETSMFGWVRGTCEDTVDGIGRFYRTGDKPESRIVSGTPWDALLMTHGGASGLIDDVWGHVEDRIIVVPSCRRKDWMAGGQCEDMLQPDSGFWELYGSVKEDLEAAGREVDRRSWAFVFDVKDIV